MYLCINLVVATKLPSLFTKSNAQRLEDASLSNAAAMLYENIVQFK